MSDEAWAAHRLRSIYYQDSHETFDDGLRAVYNAGLTRAAEIALTFIPDMHAEGERCEDCTMIRAAAAAIDAEKEKN